MNAFSRIALVAACSAFLPLAADAQVSSPFYGASGSYYSPAAASPQNNMICGPNGCTVPSAGMSGFTSNTNCGPNGCVVTPSAPGNNGYYQQPYSPQWNDQGSLARMRRPDDSNMRNLPYHSSTDRNRFDDFARNGSNQQIPAAQWGISRLPMHEQQAALQQRVCPISGELLGSSGVPVRVNFNGRDVYVCSQECASRLQQNHNAPMFTNTRYDLPYAPQFQYPQARSGLTLN